MGKEIESGKKKENEYIRRQRGGIAFWLRFGRDSVFFACVTCAFARFSSPVSFVRLQVFHEQFVLNGEVQLDCLGDFFLSLLVVFERSTLLYTPCSECRNTDIA